MKTKHTPGPWKLFAQDVDHLILTGETTGWGHDHLAVIEAPADSPEHRANVHLISAAPELYDACQVILASFVYGGTFQDPHALKAREIILNAIAKAEGKK